MSFALSPEAKREVEERLPPRVQVLHETIRQHGKEELDPAIAAPGCSSLAAGLSMGFSMLACAVLKARLPEAEAWFFVENLRCTFGFLISSPCRCWREISLAAVPSSR